MEEVLQALFIERFGMAPETITRLPLSGSHRSYYRLGGAKGASVIGAIGTDADENRAFLTLSRHFRSKGLPVPEILAVSPDRMAYIQEDLGTESLYDAVAAGRASGDYSPSERSLLLKAVRLLPRVQFEGADGIDWSVCYPQREFDARMVDFDLNYFKYDFLKFTGVEFNEVRLQDDFDRIKTDLLAVRSETFLYRDFQARNIMLRAGEPYLIDYQGGRKGPFYYDLASFAWQARAQYPEDLREEMVAAYRDALRPYADVPEAQFRRELRLFVLFRTLQVLGAYGYRGLYERKPYFLESLPYALKNLRTLLPLAEYPYLSKVLQSVASVPGGGTEASADVSTPGHGKEPAGSELSRSDDEDDRGRGRSERSERSSADACALENGTDATLTITVYSFSFRKGIPEDRSGNGGGYVFDCRGTHNPGRYEQYKQMTGRDEPVIRFLEEDGEILPFLEHAMGLVTPHARRFLERGFTSLQVSFGCTGGQHRSVFCADRMARYLQETFPAARIVLIHRERGIQETFEPSI